MSMTIVVREALCVCVGGAWALQGEKCDLNTRGNEVVAASLTTVVFLRCKIGKTKNQKSGLRFKFQNLAV